MLLYFRNHLSKPGVIIRYLSAQVNAKPLVVGLHVRGVVGHRCGGLHVSEFGKTMLIAQQEEHMHTLIAKLAAMFGVEMQDDEVDEEIQYDSSGSLRIPVDMTIAHIKDQGSCAITCYNNLNGQGNTDVAHEVAMYAISLIMGLMSVKKRTQFA